MDSCHWDENTTVEGDGLRIGFDARAIDRSGVGTYTRNLLSRFAETQLEMVVFCMDHKKDLVPESDSFSLVSANINPESSQGRGPFASMVQRAGVDLLHVPSQLAPTLTGVPLVVTIHDVIPLFYPRSIRSPLGRVLYRRRLARTVRDARFIITVSTISSSTLSAHAGVNSDKIRVIHNGVSEKFHPIREADKLEAVRHSYGLPERFALWIGEFRPHKNLEFVLGAWQDVVAQLGEQLTLVLAGTQDGDFEKVRHEAERRGLGEMVLFPGFLRESDLAAVYSCASLFVFPSLYEGFGMPPLEAMACGTPCVVSNSSSLPEVTGRAAMMFNPTSTEQFVDSVVRVLTDDDLRGKLCREGLRQSALFSWERAAQETLEVYRRALSDE
jgi:glycosyltransferase involved in cell wall biosynthesis